jgi:endonuclease YncB( thermonuclease family)
MKCNRMQEILQAMQARQPVSASDQELAEMERWHLVEVVEQQFDEGAIQEDVETVQKHFRSVSEQVRVRSQEILALENKIATSSIFEKVSLDRQLAKLKAEAKKDDALLDQFKTKMLELSIIKEREDRYVRVAGQVVQLTTIGEAMIGEIMARPRCDDWEFQELAALLEKLDERFVYLLNLIPAIMKGVKFGNLWAPFFINTGLNAMDFDWLNSNPDQDPRGIQQRLMEASLNTLYERAERIAQQPVSPANEISSGAETIVSEAVEVLGVYTSGRDALDNLLNVYASAFSHWNPVAMFADQSFTTLQYNYPTEEPQEIARDVAGRYVNNIKRFMTDNCQFVVSMGQSETIAAALIMGFANDQSPLEYFEKLFSAFPVGKDLYAAIATLLPWPKEETWAILRRAESMILQGQSASFVPELLEYALLLVFNPGIMALVGNVSPAVLAKWKYVLLPIIQASFFYIMEDDLATFVTNRPLSYIVPPQLYFYRTYGTSMLHPHVVG